jgi:acetyl esterase/lipase
MMIGRRVFLTFLATSPLASALAAPFDGNDQPLWPDIPPGGGGPVGARVENHHGDISHIAMPSLRMLRPDKPNGTAVLIAAGGGYRFISERHEAGAAAKWLVERGITAFILTYRLPGEGWQVGPLAPLQDAQRALRLIRAQAKPLGLDEGRIGCMGFSAGGHLMGMLATRFQQQSYSAINSADQFSPRPDFAVLAYPVITLKAPYDHTWTRHQLVGHKPSDQAVSQWSVDTGVKPNDPPFFIVHAKDDPVANFENALLMQRACQKASVPVELITLETGGHGFAMGAKERVVWTPALEAWMRKRQLV